jgi:hypothetical protein
MSRTISGSKYNIPGGLEPVEWANEVWSVMDEQDVGQDAAKSIVAARYAKAEERPPRDKMVAIASNKGVANG